MYPVVTVSRNKVTVNVGSDAHPMTDEHLISWIILETEDGCQRKHLSSADAPEASFNARGRRKGHCCIRILQSARTLESRYQIIVPLKAFLSLKIIFFKNYLYIRQFQQKR